MNWVQFWIMSGFPFGIQKMLVLLIPRNFGIAGSIGVLALDVIIGGMIGVIVLSRRFQRAGIRQGETCRDEAENIRSEDAGETGSNKGQRKRRKFIKFYGKSR